MADLFASDSIQRLESCDPESWTVDNSWQQVLDRFWKGPTGQALCAWVQNQIDQGKTIYPPDPLRMLSLTPLSSVKVLILGQDPYHGPGQAHGLAFSVPPGMRKPPSLRNIFKELQRDIGVPLPAHGSLQAWAERGVLLLNTCLTVEQGQAASHSGRGWEALTDALVDAVASTAPDCAYLLWGAHAQAKGERIRSTARAHDRQALILQSNHPSPLSAMRGPTPFIGCGHFSAARDWLSDRGHVLHWDL